MVLALVSTSLATLISLVAVHTLEPRRVVLALVLHSLTIGLLEAYYCLGKEAGELSYTVLSLLINSVAVPYLLLRLALSMTSAGGRIPRWVTAASLSLLCLYAYIAVCPLAELGKAALCAASAAVPLLMVASGRDPVRVLVGINMASNSLHPLLSEAPALLSLLSSVSMLLANVIGVLVALSAYREYGSPLIEGWAGWRS